MTFPELDSKSPSHISQHRLRHHSLKLISQSRISTSNLRPASARLLQPHHSEGAAVMATVSERLGFFDLPREVRDEIYRLSFSKSYTSPAIGSNYELSDTMTLIRMPNFDGPSRSHIPRMPNSRRPSRSHILQISQQVRFEAEEILFHDSTFYLHLLKSNQTLSRQLADRFIDLCIYIPRRASTSDDRDYDHRVLEMFGGSRAGGKTCTIRFYPGSLEHWIPNTRLFSILKTFTGFETVRIQDPGFIIFSDQEEIRRMEDNVRSMRDILEGGLGEAMGFKDSNMRGLEFHPQGRASAHNTELVPHRPVHSSIQILHSRIQYQS